MKNNYEFKRSFYYEAEKAIEDSRISFILGARKCGKTVCMRQLEETFDNAVYIDMKANFDDDKERRAFVNQVINSITNNENIIYLIDEATYMALPDKEIAKIASTFSECKNNNTKIVFSGSQSKALEFWGHIACGGNAGFIRTGFLSYPEWLAYKGITEVSEQTYSDFLFGVRDFYKDFNGTKEYLQGCLDETVISNRKSIEYVLDNFTDDLTVDVLLDVMYATLVKLHNPTNPQNFADAKLFERMINNYFEEMSEEETKRISEFLGSRYKNFKLMDGYDCKLAMQFLSNCGLTTLTYISDELNVDPYIAQKLLRATNDLYKKPEIFARFNLTINYPMFYIDLVQAVLKDREINKIPNGLLGSIVECQVRSLLPKNGAFEYHCNDVEIDYVSVEGKGIEISVSNKRMRNVNLDLLPDEYQKILLTKDRTDNEDGIQRIPYYQFIYDNSVGTELVEEIKKKNKEKEAQHNNSAKAALDEFSAILETIPMEKEAHTDSDKSDNISQCYIGKNTYLLTIDFVEGKIEIEDNSQPITFNDLKTEDPQFYKTCKDIHENLCEYMKKCGDKSFCEYFKTTDMEIDCFDGR